MVRNRGIALTREKLISDVWGYDFFGDDRTLDTHIKLLRKSLAENADKLPTLRGVGSTFEKASGPPPRLSHWTPAGRCPAPAKGSSTLWTPFSQLSW